MGINARPYALATVLHCRLMRADGPPLLFTTACRKACSWRNLSACRRQIRKYQPEGYVWSERYKMRMTPYKDILDSCPRQIPVPILEAVSEIQDVAGHQSQYLQQPIWQHLPLQTLICVFRTFVGALEIRVAARVVLQISNVITAAATTPGLISRMTTLRLKLNVPLMQSLVSGIGPRNPLFRQFLMTSQRQRQIVEDFKDQSTGVEQLHLSRQMLRENDLLSQDMLRKNHHFDELFLAIRMNFQRARETFSISDIGRPSFISYGRRKITSARKLKELSAGFLNVYHTQSKINECFRELFITQYHASRCDFENGELEKRRPEIVAWTRRYNLQIAQSIERELKDPKGSFRPELRKPFRSGGRKYKELFMTRAEFAAWCKINAQKKKQWENRQRRERQQKKDREDLQKHTRQPIRRLNSHRPIDSHEAELRKLFDKGSPMP